MRTSFLVTRVLLPAVFLGCLIFGITYHALDDSAFESIYMNMMFSSGAMTKSPSGAVIEPQNVHFAFQPTKVGSPKDILKLNQKVYDDVMASPVSEPKDYNIDLIRPPKDPKNYDRANATIIALVRNNEVSGIRRTLRQFEQNFNKKFEYPYTFLNDEPFTQQFMDKVRSATKAEVNFVHIPPEYWEKPKSIDEDKERDAMDKMQKENVAYAKKASYHNMCRFYSNALYQLPALQKYRYYWRIEPNVRFYSDIEYDVFKYLQGTRKIYGFTINLYDIHQSVRSLFQETLKFLNKDDNYKYIDPNGAFQWITENQQNPKKAFTTHGYSTCHFWSNFEIGDMNFFRGEAYTKWFQHLDATGNFYYERWGDAPVHSLALALFANKLQIHWFRDIGYYHPPYTHCPLSDSTKGCKAGKFDDSGNNMDQNCMATWIQYEMENLGSIY